MTGGNPSISLALKSTAWQLWRLPTIFPNAAESRTFRVESTPNHYFARLADHKRQECSRRGPFVFYFLCRACARAERASERFLCGSSSATQSVCSESFPSYDSAPSSSEFCPQFFVRDFLCARVNIFYGEQKKKTLNYCAAYYAESLGSNARIRSESALHDNGNNSTNTVCFPQIIAHISDTGIYNTYKILNVHLST